MDEAFRLRGELSKDGGLGRRGSILASGTQRTEARQQKERKEGSRIDSQWFARKIGSACPFWAQMPGNCCVRAWPRLGRLRKLRYRMLFQHAAIILLDLLLATAAIHRAGLPAMRIEESLGIALEACLVGIEAGDSFVVIGTRPGPRVVRAMKKQPKPIQSEDQLNRADLARTVADVKDLAAESGIDGESMCCHCETPIRPAGNRPDWNLTRDSGSACFTSNVGERNSLATALN